MTLCDENYFTEKYDLTRTHSDVVEAANIVKRGKTLDWAAVTVVTACTLRQTVMT